MWLNKENVEQEYSSRITCHSFRAPDPCRIVMLAAPHSERKNKSSRSMQWSSKSIIANALKTAALAGGPCYMFNYYFILPSLICGEKQSLFLKQVTDVNASIESFWKCPAWILFPAADPPISGVPWQNPGTTQWNVELLDVLYFCRASLCNLIVLSKRWIFEGYCCINVWDPFYYCESLYKSSRHSITTIYLPTAWWLWVSSGCSLCFVYSSWRTNLILITN